MGAAPGQALGPGSCLSTLHCLVLPQEELYRQSLSYRHGTRGSSSAVGKGMLLEVHRTSSCGGDDGDDEGMGGGGCSGGARRHRSRSVSPALGRRTASPARDWFKGIVSKGMWILQRPFCTVTPGSPV